MAGFLLGASLSLGLLCLAASRDVPVFDLSTRTTFSDGTNYYRYLMVDEDSNALYVGAMEYVYRLNLNNIADRYTDYAKSPQLGARDQDTLSCQYQYTPVDYHCKNHIRLITILDGEIYGCGTGAYYPLEFHLRLHDLQILGPHPPSVRNTALKNCPNSPDATYATLYVEDGNPGDIPEFYGITETTINDIRQVIYRPELSSLSGGTASQKLQTVSTNVNVMNKWLNEATFVSSFETSTHVYIFFNEIAKEYSLEYNVPRVARICKNDRGGNPLTDFENQWTSYVKVRLNCSLPGATPFYFNHLRDIHRLGNQYYGLFSTPESAMNGSAICEYTQADIDAAFDAGAFVGYDDDAGWRVVEEEEVSSPRPGTCNDDSTTLSMGTLHFINSHPLMADALAPAGTSDPICHSPLVMAHKLLIDTTTGKNNEQYIVFFLITAAGTVQKIVYSARLGETKLIADYKPFGDTETSIQYAIQHGDYMYLATDEEVKQVALRQCGMYIICNDCVQDPHCGWSELFGQCQSYTEPDFQNVFGDPLQECAAAGACFRNIQPQVVRVPGDALHMSCSSLCQPNDGQVREWYHENYPLLIDNDPAKYVQTSEHGLVILNATQVDGGSYECRVGGHVFAQHLVDVPDCAASDEGCIWKNEFRNWCAAFEDYKNDYNEWNCVKNQCINNDQCEADQISQCSLP